MHAYPVIGATYTNLTNGKQATTVKLVGERVTYTYVYDGIRRQWTIPMFEFNERYPVKIKDQS
ncbi:MAG: hypothetical protein V3U02_12625 [Calditrichia bacterium]